MCGTYLKKLFSKKNQFFSLRLGNLAGVNNKIVKVTKPASAIPPKTLWVASKNASRKYKLTSETDACDWSTSTTLFTPGNSDCRFAGALMILSVITELKMAAKTAAPILCPK